MPVVRVSLFEGVSKDVKKSLASDITKSIHNNAGIDPKWVYVIFEDVSPSNWAAEGKLFSEHGAG